MTKKLNFYQESFDSNLIEEFSFYLKEKLHFSDKDIFIHNDRLLTKVEENLIVMGDFNVIPQYNDCRYPAQWEEDALFAPEVRTKFNYLLNLGYLDAIRILDDSNSIFTQWDYRDRAWKENNGVRIDHILLSPNAADKLEESWIETSLRDKSKPSDHVPVWALLK